MAKLPASTSFGMFQERDMVSDKSKDLKEMKDEINTKWTDLMRDLNLILGILNSWTFKVRSSVNRINLAYQSQGTLRTITIAAGDVGSDVSSAHGLKYTPAYYIIVSSTVAGYVCKGDTAWDSTNVYFKAGAAGTIKVVVW